MEKGGIEVDILNQEPIYNKDGQKLYPPNQARAYLEISDATIARWRSDGWLQPHVVGVYNYYTKKQMDEVLKQKKMAHRIKNNFLEKE